MEKDKNLYRKLPSDSEKDGSRSMDDSIQIIVNGLPVEVPTSATLTDLIVRFQEMDRDLIVEVNGRFVFPQGYYSVKLAPNDRVEFIHPNFEDRGNKSIA